MKRIWISLAAAMLAINVNAQTWPDKPITLVVPGAPGTAADVLARKVGEHISSKFGQPVVVDNKVGAGGLLAYDYVARQKADGYSLAIVVGGFAIAPVLYKSLPVDPRRDLTPVAQLAFTPMVMVVRADSPWKTLADVTSAAKGGKSLTYSTGGNGSTAHLVGESFKQVAAIDMTHVPYRSSALAVPDIVSGRIDVGVLDSVAALPLVTSGRLKALAIAAPTRVPALPSVPTVAEAGVPFTAVGWVGLFAPARLPADLAQKINSAVREVMQTQDLRDLLGRTGSLPVTPALDASQWKLRFDDYVQSWGRVARNAGMTAE